MKDMTRFDIQNNSGRQLAIKHVITQFLFVICQIVLLPSFQYSITDHKSTCTELRLGPHFVHSTSTASLREARTLHTSPKLHRDLENETMGTIQLER